MSSTTKIAQHPAARPVARNIVAVASGKGGVGKTWFAITLARALARRGQAILLFDGDLGLANVDIQLGLMPEYDVASVVAGKVGLEDAIQRFEDGGYDIIAGRSGSGGLASMPTAHFNGLRTGLLGLAHSYDMVVLDLAAGVEDNVRALASLAGICLVVTTDEPTAITDAYAMIKTMAAQGQASAIRVVVNIAESRRAGEGTYDTLRKACESFLKITPLLAGVVRRDGKVKQSIQRQVAISVRYPNAVAARDVDAIAARLAAQR